MNETSLRPDNDDAPIGRVLTRREALVLLGGASTYGVLWLSGCAGGPGAGGDTAARGARADTAASALDCAVRPAQTEGPYYVDDNLTRADIRSDRTSGALQEGIPLMLALAVSQIRSGRCTPLAGATVDVWHCNALGVYSGVQDPGFNTVGQDWLRGNQATDARGMARFTTVFPGWYQGRASHIHFKIRSAAGAASSYEFTSQLYFPEPLLTSVYTSRAPYLSKGDAGRLRNTDDRIYQNGGSQLMLQPAAEGDGYSASFSIGMEMS
jgi:protocatechuate 3,4-dioxygenase beta subunit